MICINCGKEIESNIKACTYCGEKVLESANIESQFIPDIDKIPTAGRIKIKIKRKKTLSTDSNALKPQPIPLNSTQQKSKIKVTKTSIVTPGGKITNIKPKLVIQQPKQVKQPSTLQEKSLYKSEPQTIVEEKEIVPLASPEIQEKQYYINENITIGDKKENIEEEKYYELTEDLSEFTPRIEAFIIDICILGAVILILSFLIGFSFNNRFIIFLMLILLPAAYSSLMESSTYQGTFGKILMKLKVIDSNFQRITFNKALERNTIKYFFSSMFAIGFVMSFFTSRRQTLHDMVAETFVVDNKN